MSREPPFFEAMAFSHTTTRSDCLTGVWIIDCRSRQVYTVGSAQILVGERAARVSWEGATGMRHTTPRPGVYYGWLIVATTFWTAIFTGGGRTGFGIFVLPMSAELGWSRGNHAMQPGT